MRVVIHKAKRTPKRIVFPEGEEPRILRASQILLDEGIAQPILLGSERAIRDAIAELDLDLQGVQIVDPTRSPKSATYVAQLYALRKRKGSTFDDAFRAARIPNVYGMMMVRLGDADGLVSGITMHYPDTIRPALQIVRARRDARIIAGIYMMVFQNRTLFISDPTVNIEPTAEDIADIALLAAETARGFGVEPRVALLSFSSFGSTRHPLVTKVQRALELVRSRAPALRVEGEMQADIAVVPELLNSMYPFNSLKEAANVLVFPDLTSANVAYKLLARLGGATAIGPILAGMNRPVHVLMTSSEVNDVVNMAAIAVTESQALDERRMKAVAKEITGGI
jgi:malate dehydrogenase (oxaloacetate-decarboxylating)(NADP+)